MIPRIDLVNFEHRNHNGEDTKWTGPTFNATGNEVAIENLEIAHEGVEKA